MKTTRCMVVTMLVVYATVPLLLGAVETTPRRIPEGALTPEFSAVDIMGKAFACTRSSGQPLMLVFLSSPQKHSQDALEDICSVLSSVPQDRLAALRVAFVMQNTQDRDFLALLQKTAPPGGHVLEDNQYRLWGKFGVIVTPTVLISDSQGKVLCVKPGHGYDFAPVVKCRLFQALDIPYHISPTQASTVRAVTNSTLPAKAKRHLHMARMLMDKGRVGAAIAQAQMAYGIEPNSPRVTGELGSLLCQAGQAREAIKLVSAVPGQSNRDKARINLAMGWANRELGQLAEAEQFLREGIQQDPQSPRLFFELGRIYQIRNEPERAMQAYYQSLKLIYRVN